MGNRPPYLALFDVAKQSPKHYFILLNGVPGGRQGKGTCYRFHFTADALRGQETYPLSELPRPPTRRGEWGTASSDRIQ